jgi:TadE-like protein
MKRVATGGGRSLPARKLAHGQAIVEFVFVVPLLIILLLAIADFGRVFQAAIVMQSASRAAAEAAAIEYLRTAEVRAAPPAGYFDRIHEVASVAACQEARGLPNTTYNDSGGTITCPTWPAVAVCVHDADTVDVDCGDPVAGYTSGPAECTAMTSTWATAEDPQGHDYVEVRVCYRFTTLFNLDLELPFGASMSLGEIFLQNKGAFIVADY